MTHPPDIQKRLNEVVTMKERLEDKVAALYPSQAGYLRLVCDKLLDLSKTTQVTHNDINITMAILFERHEHYKEVNSGGRT